MQCFINKQRTDILIEENVPKESWNQEKEAVKAGKGVSKKEADDINESIELFRSKAQTIFREHRRTEEPLSRDIFRNKIRNPKLKLDFHQWVEEQIEQHEGARSADTIKHYRVSFRGLKAFRPELTISQLTPQLVEEFDLYLQKKGLALNTRAKYHKHLKKFSRILMRNGTIGNIYQFFQIKKRTGDRVFLNKYEVATLETMYRSEVLHPALQLKLGRFLFSCHTGIRAEGMNRISWDRFADGFVKYIPSKLEYISKTVKVPVSEHAMKYIEFDSGRMFSDLSNVNYNKGLKEIAKYADIKKNITSHVGRHTFGTGFIMQGGNVRVLQEYLDHADIQTTMIYVHLTEDREKEERHVLENLFKK